MTFIKICGITTRAQAMAVAEMGADALGFIFYPGSPRYIAPDAVRDIVASLPPFITSVGVFVNEPVARVAAVATYAGLDLVQLHGSESVEYCRNLRARAIKAVRLRGESDLQELTCYRGTVRGILLDAWSDKALGGTGEHCDWTLAARAGALIGMPLILAGGLHPGNVCEAIRQVRPYGVDASSCLELRPGFKDLSLVQDFIDRIKGPG